MIPLSRILLSRGLLTLILALSGSPGSAATDPNVYATSVDSVLLEKLADSLASRHTNTDRFDAEVWLLASEQRLQRYLEPHDARLDLLELVYQESQRHSLDPDLVLAVMQVESAFDSYAISKAGAQGLMQVMPFWRKELGRPQDNLTNVATNIRYGTTILAHYLEVAEGDLVDALARYNGSRGRLDYPELVVTAWRKVWRNKTSEDLPDLQTSCENYGLRACRYQ